MSFMREVPLYCSRRGAACVEEDDPYTDCIQDELYIYMAARHSGHLTGVPRPYENAQPPRTPLGPYA